MSPHLSLRTSSLTCRDALLSLSTTDPLTYMQYQSYPALCSCEFGHSPCDHCKCFTATLYSSGGTWPTSVLANTLQRSHASSTPRTPAYPAVKTKLRCSRVAARLFPPLSKFMECAFLVLSMLLMTKFLQRNVVCQGEKQHGAYEHWGGQAGSLPYIT